MALSSLNISAVLMVDPAHYRVEYAINPFMLDENGKLRQIDKAKARAEWEGLVRTFQKIGLRVHVLIGPKELPDMVYSANNAFLFNHPQTKQKTALLGRMRSSFRQDEIRLFEDWYQAHGFKTERLKNPVASFEGNGDALLHPDGKKIWGGFGQRTDKIIYEELKERFGFEVMLLELVHPSFYHLDTCFSILDESTAVVQPEAFTEAGLASIRAHFRTLILTDLQENLNFFTCNCFCPNGHDVVVQAGPKKFISQLRSLNFTVHEVETGEFIKGGGSVFCLKMAL